MTEAGIKALQRVKTTLEIKFEDSRDADIVMRSLEPEFQASPQERAVTGFNLRENILSIEIDADDTTSLRAALNSYLRWIILSGDVLKLGEDLKLK